MKHLRTYNLAVAFFREIKTMQMPCPIGDQLRRAASSVVLNLAEGTGRSTPKDQARFFHIAFGSVREVQSIVEIYDERFTAEQKDLIDHIAASLFKLIKGNGA